MTRRATLRLTLHQHRFALVVLGIAAVMLALDWAFVAWVHFGPTQVCSMTGQFSDPSAIQTGEQLYAIQATCDSFSFVLSAGSNFVLMSSNSVPIFAALIAASPLVASEVELGTATLAWTLARSRRAWLLPRMAFLLLAVVVIGVAAGLVTDALTGQLYIRQSPWESMYGYSGRGALITSRVLLVAAAGVFAGALLGRQMPGLLLGGVMALGIALGITVWDSQLLRANAVPFAAGETGLELDSKLQVIATGELIDWGALPAADQDPSAPGWDAKYTSVELGIPDSQAGAVVERNVIVYAIPTLLLLGLTFVVVERRRPYLS